MANALGTLFGDIAGAIREKTGDTATMKPAEFPEKIAAIEAGGGGSLPAGAYWEVLAIPYQNVYRQKWVEFNGALYAFINGTSGNSGFRYIYKYQNNAWSKVYDAGSLLSIGNANLLEPVEYNGKLHLYGGSTNKHYTFDGVSFVTKNALPGTISDGYRAMFVQDGKLKAHCGSTKTVYTWNEASDAWSAEGNVNDDDGHYFVINGVVYVFEGINVWTYKDGVRTKYATLALSPRGCGVEKNGKVYYINGNSTVSAQKLYEFDPETKAVREVGAIPTMGSSKVLSVCDHRIAFMSYECSFASTIVLHEVTE